jgi:hypothetical protein
LARVEAAMRRWAERRSADAIGKEGGLGEGGGRGVRVEWVNV